MNLTNDDVQEILGLLEASTFDQLHLETDRFKLTLRRTRSEPGGWTQEQQTTAAPKSASPTVDTPSSEHVLPAQDATTQDRTGDASPDCQNPQPVSRSVGLIDVRSPIIGTFYRASKPGAPAFVEVGSRVSDDTVIGIIETMKLMSSVYAGASGEVVEICAPNAAFVEQDQVLMRIRPPTP